jgi:hypothetical protein
MSAPLVPEHESRGLEQDGRGHAPAARRAVHDRPRASRRAAGACPSRPICYPSCLSSVARAVGALWCTKATRTKPSISASADSPASRHDDMAFRPMPPRPKNTIATAETTFRHPVRPSNTSAVSALGRPGAAASSRLCGLRVARAASIWCPVARAGNPHAVHDSAEASFEASQAKQRQRYGCCMRANEQRLSAAKQLVNSSWASLAADKPCWTEPREVAACFLVNGQCKFQPPIRAILSAAGNTHCVVPTPLERSVSP